MCCTMFEGKLHPNLQQVVGLDCLTRGGSAEVTANINSFYQLKHIKIGDSTICLYYKFVALTVCDL